PGRRGAGPAPPGVGGRNVTVIPANQLPRTSLGNRAAWRLLLTHIRPHKWAILAGGTLGLLGSLVGLAQPLIAKQVIDAFGQHRSLTGPVVTLAVLLAVGAIVSAVGSYILSRTAEGVVLNARHRLI